MLQKALDEVCDQALIHHAFTDYMRDYEMVVYFGADTARAGAAPTYKRYLFRHCVSAECVSALPPALWAQSLDERLIDYRTGADLDGYVWGVKWQCLYPGGSIRTDSARAREWSEAVGIDFHEVRFETNAHNLTLVFAGLDIAEVIDGNPPFIPRT